MQRIGILGTDNTHAHQVAGFLNGWRHEVPVPATWKHGAIPAMHLWAAALREFENRPEVDVPSTSARVTRIWDANRAEAKLIAEACDITVCRDPEDVLEDVDAVMVLSEDPATHLPLARPALEAGMPCFIDKPLAGTPEDVEAITATAEAGGAPWFSCSSVRYSADLARFRDELGTWPGSQHDRLYVQCAGNLPLYGPHALEAVNALFGRAVREVHALRAEDRAVLLLEFEDDRSALLDVVDGAVSPVLQVSALGSGETLSWELRRPYHAMLGLVEAFVAMCRTRVAPIDTIEMTGLIALHFRVMQVYTGSDMPARAS